MTEFVLMYNEGGAVKAGDVVHSMRGDEYIVSPGIGRAPVHLGSTGRIWVERNGQATEFFPSVFGCHWEERAE